MILPRLSARFQRGYTTRVSHLRGLGERDDQSWREFYEKYCCMIRSVGEKLRLSPADCDDLMQQTIAVCCERLQNFVYDPERCRFRTFLLRITLNLALNIRRRNSRYDNDAVREEWTYAPEIDRFFMEEYERFLLGRCLERLKESVDSSTYAAFDLLVLQERPIAEVAAITDMTAGALYGVKFRTMKKLCKIIAALKSELETQSKSSSPSGSRTAPRC